MFYIAYYGTSGNGYVDYKGDTCNSIDNAMTFNTKEEARQWVADKYNPAMYKIAADDGIVND